MPKSFLVLTTLYPNAAMPTHGVFVENRLRAFLKRHDADVKVIAPVPWFPFSHNSFGSYAKWAQVPETETRFGIDIYHPRYFLAPKVGMNSAPKALATCLRKAIKEINSTGWDFDFIDAHYFYPDGVAVADIAADFGKPFVVTARGTDITLIPKFEYPRKAIIKTALQSDAIITVSDGLKDGLTALGIPGKKITTLRNGVDLETFCPLDRDLIRRELNVSGPVIASVGHLIERKGHDVIIGALKTIPDATLLIIGTGEKRKALEKQVHSNGLSARVRFLGALAHEDLPLIYNAADVLALASSREGWPNVLLESMACGTPCVTTFAAGGEVIRDLSAGKIAESRNADSFANSINEVLSRPHDRIATRRYAEDHSWDETVDGMASIFSQLAQKNASSKLISVSPLAALQKSQPKLIVTVDTEEKFDWSSFENVEFSICAPGDLEPFQQICTDAGARPLYFLAYPLLKDHQSTDYFRKLVQANAADCGLHMHQWVTPPDLDFTGEYFSFQCNLPTDVLTAKFAMLANAFENVFGQRAIAHRAGRYGIDRHQLSILRDIGVTMDFSPSVAFDFSPAGGPDFSGYANLPFSAQWDNQNIYVTPVSGARAIKRTRIFRSRRSKNIGFTKPEQKKLDGAFQSMRLSPEGASLKDLQALTRRLIADDVPVITFTIHSTSLTPGGNDYSRDHADVAKMLDVTKQYLAWFRHDMKGQMTSLHELADGYAQGFRTHT